MRNRRNRNDTALTIDLAPMVDVVFLLIIFFMVSTTFINVEQSMPVQLPQAQSSRAITSDMPTVTIDANNQIYVSGKVVQLNQLPAVVRQKIESTGLRNVVFRADKIVPHGLSVQVMDKIRQAGAKQILIATGGG